MKGPADVPLDLPICISSRFSSGPDCSFGTKIDGQSVTPAPTRSARGLRGAVVPGLVLALCLSAPGLAMAAEVPGDQLSAWWGLPFAGILLSIALCPLLTPAFWHHHFGKVAAAWSLAFLLPFAVSYGPGLAASSLVHAL
ncbi:MAG: sodium:proton antiporter, partial [Rhodoferax sp.]|nr:sodium:proton antiporter [Rhodoferax sp.]